MLNFIFVALAVSALATTTARSKLSWPLRKWVSEKNDFVAKGLSCPYCMVHWYAFFLVLFTDLGVLSEPYSKLRNLFVSWFAVVGAAAIINGVIMRLNFMHEHEIERLLDQLKETRESVNDLLKAME